MKKPVLSQVLLLVAVLVIVIFKACDKKASSDGSVNGIIIAPDESQRK